jgi:hypothetical protein
MTVNTKTQGVYSKGENANLFFLWHSLHFQTLCFFVKIDQSSFFQGVICQSQLAHLFFKKNNKKGREDCDCNTQKKSGINGRNWN